MSSEEPAAAWMFLTGENLPEHWLSRARAGYLLPLLPDEVRQVLTLDPITPQLASEDVELARLLARGLSVGPIARRLGVSERSVERRLTRLRERFGLDSKAEVASFFSSRGF